MKHNHPTTEELNVKIGGLYSYTNQSGFTTKIIVTRITKHSIFVTWSDGTHEHREGISNFKKFQLVNE